jgi:N-methylhydantoinase B
MAPAGFAGEATEVFHEGLRVPPVKLTREGVDEPDIWRLLLANVRTPRYNLR